MKRFLTRTAQEGRSLWSRLPGVQKVTVVGVTLVVAGILTWFAVGARQTAYTLLAPSERLADLPGEFGEALTKEGIRWRRARGADGEDIVEVAVDDLSLALGMFPGPVASVDETSGASSALSIFISPSDKERHDFERKRQRVKESIRKIEDVRDVTLELGSPPTRKPHSVGRIESAAVQLELKSGARPLSLRAARSIRRFVAGAYQLEPTAIALTDTKGRSYLVGSGSTEVLEHEELHRDRILGELNDHFGHKFSADEFSCVLDVSVAKPPHGGTGAHSERFVVTHVRVVLTFDQDAVERSFPHPNPVALFKESAEHYVEDYLERYPSEIRIEVRPNSMPGPTTAIVAPPTTGENDVAGLFAFLGNLANVSRTTLLWIGAGLLVTMIIASTCVFSVRRRRLRSTPKTAAASSAQETGANEESREETRREAENSLVPDPLLHMAEQTSGWVRERPQAAASILKVWLTADGSAPRDASQW